MAKNLENENEQHESIAHFFSGRRSFDRQLEMLMIAVHTLERDFSALEERVRGVQALAEAIPTTIDKIEAMVHQLDKALVGRLATISITERVLWALAMAVSTSSPAAPHHDTARAHDRARPALPGGRGEPPPEVRSV